MPRFPHILSALLMLALCLAACQAPAATSMDMTGYDAGPAIITPPTRQNPVQLPPQLPAYLPNGAVNLDEAWIEDGGARLYWNTLLIPRQLKMAGATWVDPALVPPLFPPQQAKQPRKRWRAPRKAAPKAVTTVKVPEGVGSTALICVPAAPGVLPLTEGQAPVAQTPHPQTPVSPAPAAPAAPAEPVKAVQATPTAPAAPKVPAAQAPTEPVPIPPLQ
ncbi:MULTISPECIES: hypothetical protein [unclassified Desulfovibrio]|uniref:hypothetical protein n=1 Tax=unclassified Desulfovibrio TaxID=2593640 RepID=UPI0013EE2D2B|nr:MULTISPECIES: hypothetical protein [unclassified Desulfovibrio]